MIVELDKIIDIWKNISFLLIRYGLTYKDALLHTILSSVNQVVLQEEDLYKAITLEISDGRYTKMQAIRSRV